MTHQSGVPAVVADYFGITTHPAYADHPLISQTFVEGVGWKNTGFRKRISLSWIRKIKKEGVTAVEVAYQGRKADFTVEEIIKRANKDARTPLLGGVLL